MPYHFVLACYFAVYQRETRDKAEQIFRDMLHAGTDEVTGEIEPYHAHLAYLGLGRLAEARGEEETAVSFHRLQMKAAWYVWGADSAMGRNAATILASYLRQVGREEEAVKAESLIELTDELSYAH